MSDIEFEEVKEEEKSEDITVEAKEEKMLEESDIEMIKKMIKEEVEMILKDKMSAEKYPSPAKYPYPEEKSIDGVGSWNEMVIGAIDEMYTMITEKNASDTESEDKLKTEIKKLSEQKSTLEDRVRKLEETPISFTSSSVTEEDIEMSSNIIVKDGKVYRI